MLGLLIGYLVIYSAVHAELYLRLRPLLPPSRWLRAGLLCFSAFMILAPLGALAAERLGWSGLGCALAWPAYLWMGFALLAWGFSLLLWALEWLLRGALRLAHRRLSRGGRAFLVLAALPLALVVEGLAFYEARGPVLEQVMIVTAKLPPGRDRLRLVQISDLHLGCMMDRQRLARVVALVQAQRPDLLVATGDMVDGYIPQSDHIARILAEIKAPLGKYAVIGNHEHYRGLAQSLDFLRRAGFTVLRQESATPAGVVNLVGIDDPGRSGGARRGPPEAPAFKGAVPGLYTIVLKHRPWVDPQAAGRFDLQLSGHTHGGQVFPFGYLVRLAFPHLSGLYRLPRGNWLYVSRGAGTWGPPIRLLAPPEVTVVDLVRGGRPETKPDKEEK